MFILSEARVWCFSSAASLAVYLPSTPECHLRCTDTAWWRVQSERRSTKEARDRHDPRKTRAKKKHPVWSTQWRNNETKDIYSSVACSSRVIYLLPSLCFSSEFQSSALIQTLSSFSPLFWFSSPSDVFLSRVKWSHFPRHLRFTDIAALPIYSDDLFSPVFIHPHHHHHHLSPLSVTHSSSLHPVSLISCCHFCVCRWQLYLLQSELQRDFSSQVIHLSSSHTLSVDVELQ